MIQTLLQDKPFISLDESLSALDQDNYQRIESYLLALEDICLIHISHRDPAFLGIYDHILDLDQLG